MQVFLSAPVSRPDAGPARLPLSFRRHRLLRLLRLLVPLAMAAAPAFAVAQQAQTPHTAWFVQAGVSENNQALTVGATRDWRWQKQYRLGLVTGYWEGAVGRWLVNGRGSHDVTQVGLTPVLRLYPQAWQPGWFIEGGIGANVIFPTYDDGKKRFSTTFQFGDHLAVGKRFGQQRQHEWAVRFQHFSNARIERPNPGENFLQLRYSRQW